MAGRQWREPGGIRSLRELIVEHPEAVEYDLICLGLRLDWLGSERLSWRDLLVVVNQSRRGSALYRALHPKEAEWGLGEHLLALNLDRLRDANWQRGGGVGPQPEPTERPGVDAQETRHGSSAVSIDEMNRQLGWEVSP